MIRAGVTRLEATLAFIERRMTAPEGGFYSALDAETKGEEGAYYVWTRDQVKANLAGDLHVDLFSKVYGLEAEPNFEGGRYVLHESRTRAEQSKALKITTGRAGEPVDPIAGEVAGGSRQAAGAALRRQDTTGWNGLMIAAYADGYRVLKVDKYRQIAEKAATFLLEKLRLPDGRLLTTLSPGQSQAPRLPRGLRFLHIRAIGLHAATGEARWLKEARSLADRMIADLRTGTKGDFSSRPMAMRACWRVPRIHSTMLCPAATAWRSSI